MKCKVHILLVAVLLGISIAKSADAIKCYQCDECPGKENLPDLKECTKVNWFDAFIKQREKVTGKKMQMGKAEMEQTAAALGMGFDAVPTNCFKQYVTFNNKELMYRGCAAPKESVCEKLQEDKTTLCICNTDGCNSAPTAFIRTLVIAICLSVVFLFMYP